MKALGRVVRIVSVFVLLMTFTITARAERWIIKNPKQTTNFDSIRGLVFHTTLNLKINSYMVVEINRQISRNELVSFFQADEAFPDAKIVIDKPIVSAPVSNSRVNAWHVNQLKYSELNSKYTGQGVIVAVIDSGADYNHPALKSKMWINKKEIPDNKIDDDRNGLIDDYHGYNFSENLSDPMDTFGHGTHCSGIIGANKDPDSNAQGIAQGVIIMPLKIITDKAEGFLSAAALAVKYATDHGAKVLSNSWRIYDNWTQFMDPLALEMLKESIEYAGDHGVIFVAAAGNESMNIDSGTGHVIFPLSLKGLKNMVGIASTSYIYREAEELSSYSNYGRKSVALSAPGQDIYSTYPDNRWRFMSGTSMAAPIVSGALARGLSKGYSMQEALSELNQTAQKTTYWQQYITYGKIDVKKYLE